jgi:sugar lactone lactonase YvrE
VSTALGDGKGAQCVAFDAEGNLWWVDYGANALKMLDVAGVTALDSVASNPAPTRVVEMPVGTEADGLAADATGLWVCETKEGGSIVHFAWSNLATSGSASPDKSLASPGDWPMVIWTQYVMGG